MINLFTPEYQCELISQLSPLFPQGKDFRIEKWVQILGGAETITWRFDFLFSVQDLNLSNSITRIPMVVRIFRQGGHVFQAQREFIIMKELHQAGISLPKTYCYSPSPSVLNTSYLVMDFVEGSLLGEFITRSSDEEKFKFIAQFIETMLSFHQIKWSSTFPGLIGESEKFDTLHCINQILATPKYLIHKYDIKELIPLLEWLESNKLKIIPSSPVLIHGDFHANNVFVNKQQKLVVLDWSNAKINDFRIDLAFAITSSEGVGGFELKSILITLYEQKSSQKVNDIEFFMILSNFNNLLRMYSLAHNYEITGENEETKNIFQVELGSYASYLHNLIYTETGISIETLRDF